MKVCKLNTSKPIRLLFYTQVAPLNVYFVRAFKFILGDMMNYDPKPLEHRIAHVAVEVNNFTFHMFDRKNIWIRRDRADRMFGSPYRVLEVGQTYYPFDYIIGYSMNFPVGYLALRSWVWFLSLAVVWFGTFGFVKRPFINKIDCTSICLSICVAMIDNMPMLSVGTPSIFYEELIKHGYKEVIE